MKLAAALLRLATFMILYSQLTACADHTARLQAQSQQSGADLILLYGEPFDLLAVGHPTTIRTSTLRIYLEGDGKAWASRTQPSSDPSPRDLWWVRLAVSDIQPSVYLSRPCQFIRSPQCTPALWTGRRFAPEVVTSMDKAIDNLKARYGVTHLELIGYSGGGHLALVLAGLRNDVVQVQTVAGNLDPIAWARHHQVSTLEEVTAPGSLTRLRQLPQRHFVGQTDTIVPPALTRQMVASAAYQCVSIITIDASHTSGWEALGAMDFDAPLLCDAP